VLYAKHAKGNHSSQLFNLGLQNILDIQLRICVLSLTRHYFLDGKL
jgi:hypothetical protein